MAPRPFMMNRTPSIDDLEATGVSILTQWYATASADRALASQEQAFASLALRAETPRSSTPDVTPDEAPDIVDALQLSELRLVTPPSTPTRHLEAPVAAPSKKSPKKAIKKKAAPAKAASPRARRESCLIPTTADPLDPAFLTTLWSPRDTGRINPAHEAIRRDVLEVRRTRSGRIFFQCKWCKHLPRDDRVPLSVMVPKKLKTMYRSLTVRFSKHVKGCTEIPEGVRSMKPSEHKVASAGTTKYWVKSAERIGLVNGKDGKSIVYCQPAAN